MKKRYLPFTVPRWLTWVLLICFVLFIVLAIYLISIYNEVQQSKQSGFQASEELALSKTDLTSVKNVTRYHGETHYHVVVGSTQDDEAAIVYVPVDTEEQKLQFFDAESFVSREDVISSWQTSCSSCQFISANLAIDNQRPLWEIKYIDNQDRYVFEYFLLEDGTSYEHFRLQRSLY
ncbi:DUF5590 domain-containing protein [Aquibacillus sediminis]|uniref:cell wall elongation regulator TseB-like domain-containing protein n=1 Tax=Aquibacillus sediminis TaxID=2574734 RepID=UPI001108125B|nr:DUF5590 domain-containing protein [Aquibacillus sediminis]